VVLINGGSDGGRIRLAPQKDWQVNNPSQLAKVLDTLQSIQTKFNTAQSTGKLVSIADLVVLAGCAAIEKSAQTLVIQCSVPLRQDALMLHKSKLM
jgi:catalase-peroxidase